MSLDVVTLEQEYGSGGRAIAAKLAVRLGWKLWDQGLTEEIARRLGCACRAVEEREEKRDPAYYRLLKYFNVEWPQRDRCHLMVNSAMGDDVAVAILLDAMERYAAA